jgi:hypothetical protein
MGRPRTRPAAEETAAEPSGKTVKLTYTGPPDQAVVGLNEVLEEGNTYDVPEELAEGLVAGSAWWEEA